MVAVRIRSVKPGHTVLDVARQLAGAGFQPSWEFRRSLRVRVWVKR